MKKIKKLGILSFAKFQAILVGIIGLVCGVLYSFGGLFIDILVSLDLLSATAMETPGLSYGTFLAFGALIGMPVIFLIGGFFLGIVEAFLYNQISKWLGGFQLDIS